MKRRVKKEKDRCVQTKRPRGLVSKLGISRIVLREAMSEGKLTGFRKASW